MRWVVLLLALALSSCGIPEIPGKIHDVADHAEETLRKADAAIDKASREAELTLQNASDALRQIDSCLTMAVIWITDDRKLVVQCLDANE